MWTWLVNLFKKKVEVANTPKPMMVKKQVPEYFKIALEELGELEISGNKHNPRIIEYHAATSLDATTDEVAWCSSFVNWCMDKAAMPKTNSAMARSWLKWGVEVKLPKTGDVVIFWRGTPEASTGHVGFYVKEFNKDYVTVLGGNQSNSVCYSNYKKSQVLGYRR